MDFGGGFAAGIGAGMGSGVAIGISSGKKRAAAELRDYLEREQIEMVDRHGKRIEIETVMNRALPDCCGAASSTGSGTWTGWLLAGLGVLLAVALAAYALLR